MIIVISGASKGIGKAIAIQFAQKKYTLVLLARGEDALLQAQHEAQQFGADVHSFICDISNENSVKEVTNQIFEKIGVPDVLINNAGVGGFKTLANFSIEEYDRMMDINVKGSFLLTKYILPAMQHHKRGHIIAIASDVAKRTFYSGSLYCATKYAQDAMFSALRKEVRQDNIKVSVVYSGMVDTYFEGNIPSGKPERLRSEDIAQAVDYIVSAPANVVIDELMIHPIQQEY
jgi:NADP-dependent 3-hydroxy acid dehydrogenase YdfG